MIAVTGATGFVGQHICRALLAAGHPVRAVVRSPEKAALVLPPQIDVQQADLLQPDALELALSGASAVVSNAALGSWAGPLEYYERVNVGGIRHLLTATQAAGIERLVHVSTLGVHHTRLHHWHSEDSPRIDPSTRQWSPRDLTTDWRYTATKARAEDLVQHSSLQSTILRPGPLFGPADTRLTARWWAARTRPVVLAPTLRVPLLSAADVASAVVAALSRSESIGKSYVLAGPPTGIHTVHRTWNRLAGTGPVVVPVPVPGFIGVHTSRAARDLGFAPRSLEDALSDVILAGSPQRPGPGSEPHRTAGAAPR